MMNSLVKTECDVQGEVSEGKRRQKDQESGGWVSRKGMCLRRSSGSVPLRWGRYNLPCCDQGQIKMGTRAVSLKKGTRCQQ